MRTMLAGIRALRRTPLAALPLTIEGLIGGVLVIAGAIPASGAGVPSTAVFPLDVFYDVKQSIAYGNEWIYVVAAVFFGVLVRGAVLGSTLWLAEGRPGSFVPAWYRASVVALIAAVALLPAAALFFTGTATRYAPFIWIGGLLGVLAALLLVRRALNLDVGRGKPEGSGVPEAPGFISYAYLITAFGAAMSVLSDSSKWPAALLIALLGPLHALFLIGWREHLRNGTYPGGGTIVTAISILLVVALFALAAYDRYIRDPAPVGRAPARGMLIVLGGVDSTSKSGALADLDPRILGFPRSVARQLSYRGAGQPYRAEDTRINLTAAARRLGEQIRTARRPRNFLGHSQAALILDRILKNNLARPEKAVQLAAPPPLPPSVDIPPPDEAGAGKAGGDLARVLASLLDRIGVRPFDVDAPSSPTNVQAVVIRKGSIPRLSVWPLADSVWLEGDWRRPGERNLIAFTDHVGVTDNASALTAARDFFANRDVDDDESSWKGVAVGVLKYAFEPWRPQ